MGGDLGGTAEDDPQKC